MFCRHCGAQVSDDSAFCQSCGNPLASAEKTKFCTSCGNQIPEGAGLCPICGMAQNTCAQQEAQYNQYGAQQGSYNGSTYGGYQQNGNYYNPDAQINREQDLLRTLIKVFMIIGCLSIGWMLIPLLWLIPMTSKTFKALDSHAPLTIGFKICVLLFVSRLAGIMLICLDD